jgi:hypothetical protein
MLGGSLLEGFSANRARNQAGKFLSPMMNIGGNFSQMLPFLNANRSIGTGSILQAGRAFGSNASPAATLAQAGSTFQGLSDRAFASYLPGAMDISSQARQSLAGLRMNRPQLGAQFANLGATLLGQRGSNNADLNQELMRLLSVFGGG